MSNLVNSLSSFVGDAFAALGLSRDLGTVVPSGRPDLGQFQCNGAFAAARTARRSPRDIATDVAAGLSLNPNLVNVTVAGNGFVNLSVTPEFLAEVADTTFSDPRLGCPTTAEPMNVVIDFGGPNVAKAMHVGHIRSSIIGDCLQRLFRFVGHNVTSDIHLGDWGTQMGMLIVEAQRRWPDLPYFDADFTGPYPDASPVTLADLGEMYPIAAARSKADPEEAEVARQATAQLQLGRPGYRALWQHFVDISRQAMEDDFHVLGVHFDLWWGESTVQDDIAGMVERLEADGIAVLSEGMLVVPLPAEVGKKDMPPLLLLKSDGAVIYGTTDLATIARRVEELNADLVLYVVDKRQSLHFSQLFAAARLVDWGSEVKLEHIKFGTVNGPDRKPFKTRAGSVMTLGDLLAIAIEQATRRIAEGNFAADLGEDERRTIARQVGIGAVKLADLQHERISDYVFDVEKFTSFDGYTGPYLQYQAVRCRSVLRKAQERGLSTGPLLVREEAEANLLLEILQLPDSVDAAVEGRAPYHLCGRAYEIAKNFSRFYRQCPILSEPDESARASRLGLTELTLRALELLLSLVGIEVPDRM